MPSVEFMEGQAHGEIRGLVLACAQLARDLGEDALAFDIMDAAGLTVEEILSCGLEAYDTDPLVQVLNDRG